MVLVSKLQAVARHAAKYAQERDDVVQAILLGLLTKNHVFLYGEPGTAKSFAARLIGDAISGAHVFRKQLTRQMTEEAVFGPLDIPRWRKLGEYVYRTEGGLAEAEIAILEEYFDASDALIRSMNELLNEREFTRSLGHIKKCPLHTAIATSNFWRSDEDAQAVADRFLIRVNVSALTDKTSRVQMVRDYLEHHGAPQGPHIDFALVKKLCSTTRKITVPDEVLDLYEGTVQEFRSMLKKTTFVSDRRIAWSALLLRAAALLDDRDAVLPEDISTARFGLAFMGRDDEEAQFMAAYNKIVGIRAEAAKVSDALDRLRVTMTGLQAEVGAVGAAGGNAKPRSSSLKLLKLARRLAEFNDDYEQSITAATAKHGRGVFDTHMADVQATLMTDGEDVKKTIMDRVDWSAIGGLGA